MAVAVADLPVGTVDEQLSAFATGNRASPVDCIALGGGGSRDTLGAFASPSPLIAVRDDVDVVVFWHMPVGVPASSLTFRANHGL